MVDLDMTTVLANYTINSMLCAIVVFTLWRQNRRRSPELVFWFADFVCQSLALTLILLRGRVPDLISIVFANALVIGGTILLYIGLERYLGRVTRQTHNYVMLGVFVALYLYFTYAQPSLLVRNAIASFGLCFITIQLAWLMLKGVDRQYLKATWGGGVVFLLYALISGIRGVGQVLQPQISDLFQLGVFDTSVMMIYELLFIGLTFSLFLLVNQRLFWALEEELAARTQTEAALRQSREKFELAFHSAPYALMVTSLADGAVLDANDVAATLFGFEREELLAPASVGLGLWDDPGRRAAFVDELRRKGQVLDFEASLRKKSGAHFVGAASGGLIEVDSQPCILMAVRDVTEDLKAEEVLRALSIQDPLTGLLNQREFHRVAPERLRTRGDEQASLVFMDVDNLKSVNDVFGHQAGDDALVLFTSALCAGFRESDIIARMGGDEFAVLAISREAVTEQSLVARFEHELRVRNESRKLPFEISVSIGVAQIDAGDDATDLRSLIGVADTRMYESKRRKQARDPRRPSPAEQ